MRPDYAGVHVWIIGASSGIGRALAVELARRGARLTLSARREDDLRDLNAELGGGHGIYALDVADARALEDAAAAIEAAGAEIDSVVLLAALYQPGRLSALDPAAASTLVDVNLKGAFNLLHAVLPRMAARERGQIALCGSLAGYRGLPAGQPYSATKAAIINLAESLRGEYARRGIDVKLINPGFVRTPMTARNTFPMPMMIEAEQAARAIAAGLRSKAFEIRFPRRFSVIMKVLRLLPAPLFFLLTRPMDKSARE